VPLRDIDEFHRWVARESPSVTAQRAARNFLAQVVLTSFSFVAVVANRVLFHVGQGIADCRAADTRVTDLRTAAGSSFSVASTLRMITIAVCCAIGLLVSASATARSAALRTAAIALIADSPERPPRTKR